MENVLNYLANHDWFITVLTSIFFLALYLFITEETNGEFISGKCMSYKDLYEKEKESNKTLISINKKLTQQLQDKHNLQRDDISQIFT